MRGLAVLGFIFALAPMQGAQASTLPVEGTFSIGGTAFTDPGLVVHTYPSSGNLSFELQQGASEVIPLFDIWTNETSVNGDDRDISGTLEVGFNFTEPNTSGQSTGTVVGQAHFFNIVQNGSLQWNGPLEVAYGGSEAGLITILLSDVSFNWGLFGLSPGPKFGATVFGSFSYDVAAVPLPGAFVLLLTGLVSMIWLGLRRSRIPKLAEAAS